MQTLDGACEFGSPIGFELLHLFIALLQNRGAERLPGLLAGDQRTTDVEIVHSSKVGRVVDNYLAADPATFRSL